MIDIKLFLLKYLDVCLLFGMQIRQLLINTVLYLLNNVDLFCIDKKVFFTSLNTKEGSERINLYLKID